MELKGYVPRCGKTSGGIRTLSFARAKDLNGVYFSEGYVTEIEMSDGKRFEEYYFREDSAQYTETITRRGASFMVTHRLEFLMPVQQGSNRAFREILEAGRLIALVKTNDDQQFIVGVSKQFGLGRPLRVAHIGATTGRKICDDSGELIVLESTDCDTAPLFTALKPE